MAVQIWGDNFAGQGQNQPTDLWPVIDLNPEEWREIEECPTLPPPHARAASHGTNARGGGCSRTTSSRRRPEASYANALLAFLSAACRLSSPL
jgi:hypothetical protein